LYQGYRAFCVEDGYRAVNNRNFQKRLNANGILTERARFGFVAYVRKTELTF
jgi:putative DNA primase/helicase